MSKDFNFIFLIPFITFVVCFTLQQLWPTRKSERQNYKRWLHHSLLFLINNIILRFLVPISLVAVAMNAQQHQWGLFQLVSVNKTIAFLVCFLVLDCAVYWQHVFTHKINFLWQLHKVHHTDMQMDVTTAIRFHPIELVLSLIYKSVIVILLGAPVSAVLWFEIALMSGALFNHSNLAIPDSIDKALRKVIVTPDVHRSHHSVYKHEQDTNYGFFLIWWDKLFSTYTKEPKDGHQAMQIGLANNRQLNHNEPIDQLLLMPFKKS